MEHLTFADLIDIDSLRSMQESFSNYTGLAICVTSPKGECVVKSTGGAEFCWKYTQGCRLGAERCAQCDQYGAHLAFSQNKAVHYVCHAGMIDFVIPVMFEKRVIGTILAGQVRSDEFDPEKARAAAAEMGIDPDEYVDAAMRAGHMSYEEAEETAEFLSEFAEALSVMAHENYNKLVELRKTERIARSQAEFITGLTDNLHTSMKDWIDRFGAATEKYMNIPEIENETYDLLLKAGEVYSQIDDAIDYIRMAEGNSEYYENVYDIRDLVDMEASSLQRKAEEAGVRLGTSFDELLPETLVGNSGRIGQIINKISGSLVSFTNKGGSVEISVFCDKTDYSCNLMFEIRGIGTRMTEKAAAAINASIQGGGANVFTGTKSLTPQDTDFDLIVLLLNQMSGNIEAESLADGFVAFRITIPQLDGSKKNA